eukprot:ctg_301.g180
MSTPRKRSYKEQLWKLEDLSNFCGYEAQRPPDTKLLRATETLCGRLSFREQLAIILIEECLKEQLTNIQRS